MIQNGLTKRQVYLFNALSYAQISILGRIILGVVH